MSRLETVKSSWDEFEADIIPKDAPEIQRHEMKRAFYMGALFGVTFMGERSRAVSDIGEFVNSIQPQNRQ